VAVQDGKWDTSVIFYISVGNGVSHHFMVVIFDFPLKIYINEKVY